MSAAAASTTTPQKRDDGDSDGEGASSALVVVPRDASLLRKIITTRRQQRKLRQREDRLRQQAQQIELDKQIFKDELATAAAKHKEGANPKIIPLVSPPPSPSSTGGDSDVTATLFHYYDRRLPVRHQAVPKDASGDRKSVV